MFEGFLEKILNRVIGHYVEGISSEDMKVGFLSGDVEIKNLRLKKKIIEELNLPFELKFGLIQRLKLKVPWKNLRSSAVEAELDGLYLLIVPKKRETWKNLEYDLMQNRHSSLVKFAQDFKTTLEEKLKMKGKEEQGYFGKIIQNIIDNLQINIQNIHIRFESEFEPIQKMSLGVTLDSLEVYTCDQNWQRSEFLDRTVTKETQIHKTLTLNNFRVYWNSQETVFLEKETSTPDQLKASMKELIFKQGSKPINELNYLLQFSTEARLVQRDMNQELVDSGKPQFDLSISMDSTDLALNKRQVMQMVDIVNVINEFMSIFQKRREKYKTYMLRPSVPIRMAENAEHKKKLVREFWKYAKTVIITRNKQENQGLKTMMVYSRKGEREIKERFLSIFEELLKKKDPLKMEFDPLDARFYETVVMSMDITKLEAWIGERIKTKQKEEQLQKKKDSKKGYFSGWFGGGGDTTSISAEEEEEISNFVETIARTADVNIKYPDNYKKFCVQFMQKSFRVNLDKKSLEGRASERVSLVTDHLLLNLQIKEKGVSMQASLGSFGIFYSKEYDVIAGAKKKENLYEPVLYSKSLKSADKSKSDEIIRMHRDENRTEYYDNPLCGNFLQKNYTGAKKTNLFSVLDVKSKDQKKSKGNQDQTLLDQTIPFFYLRFDESPEEEEGAEKNFSSPTAKMIKSVEMEMGSIKIIFVKQAIDFLSEMFRFENIDDEISEKIKTESRQKLKRAQDISGKAYQDFLKDEKLILLSISIRSPEIVMPLDFRIKGSSALVFWPGNLYITDGITEDKRLEKEIEKTSIYDRFHIKLANMELEYCQDFRIAKTDLHDKRMSVTVEKVSQEQANTIQQLKDEILKQSQHDDEDEYCENQNLIRRYNKAQNRRINFLKKRKKLYHSMFREFTIKIQIELLKNFFVLQGVSDPRKKINAELTQLKLEVNSKIVNELIGIGEAFVVEEEVATRLEKQRNIENAVLREYVDLSYKNDRKFYFVLVTRTKMLFFKNIKEDDSPLKTIRFDDMPKITCLTTEQAIKIEGEKPGETVKLHFRDQKKYRMWEKSMRPIQKKITIKEINMGRDEELRKRRQRMKLDEKDKLEALKQSQMEATKNQNQENLELEPVEISINFTFNDFTLVMAEASQSFRISTQHMTMELNKTDSKMDLDMSLSSFEVMRSHPFEEDKFIITSDYSSSITSKIFKGSFVQKQQKLIKIQFNQIKNQPDNVKVHFGCLFITLEPALIREFVDLLAKTLAKSEENKRKRSTITSRKKRKSLAIKNNIETKLKPQGVIGNSGQVSQPQLDNMNDSFDSFQSFDDDAEFNADDQQSMIIDDNAFYKEFETENLSKTQNPQSLAEKYDLNPHRYKHLENNENKMNDISEAKRNLNVQVTIENISILLISTVADNFIPLAQLSVKQGSVGVEMSEGVIDVKLTFKDLLIFDLTNYPNTLNCLDYNKIKPMKLFGQLKKKNKGDDSSDDSLIYVRFLMREPQLFNLENGVCNELEVKIQNVHINLYLQAVLRILGFLTDQLLPSLEVKSPKKEEENALQTDNKVNDLEVNKEKADKEAKSAEDLDTKKIHESYLAVKKPLWIKMNIQISQTEVHMNTDVRFNERIRVYLGEMKLENDKRACRKRILLIDKNEYGIDSVWEDRYSFRLKGLQIFLEERRTKKLEYTSKELMRPFGMRIDIDLPMNEDDYRRLFKVKTVCNPNKIYMDIGKQNPKIPEIEGSENLPRLVYDTTISINNILEPFIAVLGNVEYLAVMRALEENVSRNDLRDEYFVVDYVKKEQEKKSGSIFVNLLMDHVGFVCIDNDNNDLVDSKIYIDNMRLQLLMTPEGEMHLQMGIEDLFGYYLAEHDNVYYEKGFINDFGEAERYVNVDPTELKHQFVAKMAQTSGLFDRKTTLMRPSIKEGNQLYEIREEREIGSDIEEGYLGIEEAHQKFFLKLTGDNSRKDIRLKLKGLKILVETTSLLKLMDLTVPKTKKDVKYSKIVAKRKLKQEQYMKIIQKRGSNKLKIEEKKSETKKIDDSEMNVQIEIKNNFFYIPTNDLKSALVATGNIEVNLQKRDFDLNWRRDLKNEKKMERLNKKVKRFEKKEESEKKEVLKKIEDERKNAKNKNKKKSKKSTKSQRENKIGYQVDPNKDSLIKSAVPLKKDKKLSTKEKREKTILRIGKILKKRQSMSLDVDLRKFEIYLTDFLEIVQKNSKDFRKKRETYLQAKTLKENEEEEYIKEKKTESQNIGNMISNMGSKRDSKIDKYGSSTKNKGTLNKRELLLPWTFMLSLKEYRYYKEVEVEDPGKEALQQLYKEQRALENIDLEYLENQKNEKDAKPKKENEDDKKIESDNEDAKNADYESQIIEKGWGEKRGRQVNEEERETALYPIVRVIEENKVTKKAKVHSQKLIEGKLDQLIFDISLKDIELIQKIQTYHLSVLNKSNPEDQSESKNKDSNKKNVKEENKKNQKDEDEYEEPAEVNSMQIKFHVEKQLRISLVNDFENVFVRSLVLQLNKLSLKGNMGADTHILLGFGLEIMYYNSGLTSWEPFLEKTNLLIEFDQKTLTVNQQLAAEAKKAIEKLKDSDSYKKRFKKKKKEKRGNVNQLRGASTFGKTPIQESEIREFKEDPKISSQKNIIKQEQIDFEQRRTQAVDHFGIREKRKTEIRVVQGKKLEEYEGSDEVMVREKEGETMNLNVSMALLEKLIFFSKVAEDLKKEGENLTKELGSGVKKLMYIKSENDEKDRKKEGKGKGTVSPARVVNHTGYTVHVKYEKKQIQVVQGTDRVKRNDKKMFSIKNRESFPLFWDNFEEEALFKDDHLGEGNGMDTFYYKTLSFQIQHPVFEVTQTRSLSLNDNFDRKLITRGRQRVLSDFRVLCNSRNIGDLKEITISSQVLIENQLVARGCRRMLNIETIHPRGRSLISIEPGRKKYIPFDLVNFETRIYANRERMNPQNFKLNAFIMKEENYKVVFHSTKSEYNFVLRVERDPKFFYLTRLVAVPAIAFKNELPYHVELLLSNGRKKELFQLKQGDSVYRCDLSIRNDVVFMMGILKPNQDLDYEENRNSIIQQIKHKPYDRYSFKSKSKLILEKEHMGSDYKKILSIYDVKSQKNYFSMVRWIRKDTYFGFLLYSDSAIINETPYAFEFQASEDIKHRNMNVVPQIEYPDSDFNRSGQTTIHQSQVTNVTNNSQSNNIPSFSKRRQKLELNRKVTLLSSKRTSLQLRLKPNLSSQMIYFSEKYSNKILTQGLVGGSFIINLQRKKKKEIQSMRSMKTQNIEQKDLTKSLFNPGIGNSQVGEDNQIQDSKFNLAESHIPGDPNQEMQNAPIENDVSIFPNSEKITANKMYLEVHYKTKLVYNNENKGALATKAILLCAKTIVSNETDNFLSIKQKHAPRLLIPPRSKKPLYTFVGENGKNKLFSVALLDNAKMFKSRVRVDFNNGGSVSMVLLEEGGKNHKIARVEMLIEDEYNFVKVEDRTNKKDMIVTNKLGSAVRISQVKQAGDFCWELKPGRSKEVAWLDPYNHKKLKVEFLHPDYEVEDDEEEKKQKRLKMQKNLEGMIITGMPTIKENPGDSNIKSEMRFLKKKKKPVTHTQVKRLHSTDLNTDQLKETKKRIFNKPGEEILDEFLLEISNMKKAELMTKRGKQKLVVDIKLNGRSRVIEMESQDLHDIEKQRNRAALNRAGAEVTTFYATLSRLGISIIGRIKRQRKELFYLYVHETNFFYQNEGPETQLQFQVRYLNIDNNYSSQCRFPVLFTCGQSLNEMIRKDQFMINLILKMTDVDNKQKNQQKAIESNKHSISSKSHGSQSIKSIGEQSVLDRVDSNSITSDTTLSRENDLNQRFNKSSSQSLNPIQERGLDKDQNDSEDDHGQTIQCFDEITLELSPLTINLEFGLLSVIQEFQSQMQEVTTTKTVSQTYLSKYFMTKQSLATSAIRNQEKAVTEWQGLNTDSSTWIYCNKLNISMLKLIVTFTMNKEESTGLSKSEDSYANVILNSFGSALLNIDESPLQFKGISMFYVFESSNGLISLYMQHLKEQAKINLVKLVGSIDILGNPTNLFGNVSNGVVQFFEKPVEGFKKGPISGVKGIASGTGALLKNTAAGGLNAISKFTGSLASGLTTLSNDKSYQRQRNLKKAKKPRGAIEGLESGAVSIGKGVWSGVTGIITQPVKEVKKSGAIGIFKGLFKGITGVVTKPLGGLLDATSQTTEGIKKSITKHDEKANEFKQRPPRVFYKDKSIIKTYDNNHARRVKALVKVAPSLENESLVDSVDLNLNFGKKNRNCILIITNKNFNILNETLSKLLIRCETLDIKTVNFTIDPKKEGDFYEQGKIEIKYNFQGKLHDLIITAKKKKVTRIVKSIYYTRYLSYLERL